MLLTNINCRRWAHKFQHAGHGTLAHRCRTYTLEGRFTNAEGVHQGAKSLVATMGILGNGLISMHVIECKMSN